MNRIRYLWQSMCAQVCYIGRLVYLVFVVDYWNAISAFVAYLLCLLVEYLPATWVHRWVWRTWPSDSWADFGFRFLGCLVMTALLIGGGMLFGALGLYVRRRFLPPIKPRR